MTTSRPPSATPDAPSLPVAARTHGIALRLFVAVALPAALVVVVLGALVLRSARATVEESLRRELAATAAMAATTVNPTLARAVLAEEQESSRTQRRVVARLHALQLATRSSRVMLFDDTEAVRADGDGVLRIGEPAPRVALDRLEVRNALQGTPTTSALFSGADGRRYLAAYALVPEPVGERDDDVDAARAQRRIVLALEAPAAAIDAVDALVVRVTVLIATSVVLVFALAFVVARTITRPLRALSRHARSLGGGVLHEALPTASGDDEVAQLSRTLEAMRVALAQRDTERQMMLAGIAHEVRNPLGGIELFSGLLQEGIDELRDDDVGAATRRELQEQVGRVRRELHYLTDVVNDFLTFARDTAVAREPVDVAGLLHDVAGLCARPGAPTILVEVDALPDHARIWPLDRSRIKQALLNVVDNALAASAPAASVTLRASQRTDALVIEVIDTGVGVDAQTAARVFTPFFTTKEKGSGLGLPLVRKLARDHGGDAEFSSTPGVGTTVAIVVRRA